MLEAAGRRVRATLAGATGNRLTVLHHNVFGDGLHDTPGSTSFSPEFYSSFGTLLQTLCQDGAGGSFWVHAQSRDMTRLPPAVQAASPTAFFGAIDNVYTVVYHPLSGEARFGDEGPGNLPNCGTSLINMFLRTSLARPGERPSADNMWNTAAFEDELLKSLSTVDGDPAARLAFEEKVRGLRTQNFDEEKGELTWEATPGSTMGELWKRETPLLVKWGRNATTYINACQRGTPAGASGSHPTLAAADAEALARFMTVHVMPNSEVEGSPSNCRQPQGAATATAKEEGSLQSLIEAHVDAGGKLVRLRTLTHQSAARFLINAMCSHSLGNPTSAAAVAAFAGVAPASVPPDAEGRAQLIFPSVQRALTEWTLLGSLDRRHQKFCATIARTAPSIVTLAEYDERWAKLPLPTAAGRVYACVDAGRGTSRVMYDANVFDLAPAALQPAGHRIWGTFGPKSSCVVVLRRKSDAVLFLVAAVHFESGPVAETRKVQTRSVQLRTLLHDISLLAGTLRQHHEQRQRGAGQQGSSAVAAAGPFFATCNGQAHVIGEAARGAAAATAATAAESVVLVVGGDFNMLAPEFVHGNSPAYYRHPLVQVAHPPSDAPVAGSVFLPPFPAVASLHHPTERLRLRLGQDVVEAVARENLVLGKRFAAAGIVKQAELDALTAHAARVGDGDAGFVPGELKLEDVPTCELMQVSSGDICTRAGRAEVIDYVLLGCLGSSLACRAEPLPLATAEEEKAAANIATGIRSAVLQWGSDHLPVGASISSAQSLTSGAGTATSSGQQDSGKSRAAGQRAAACRTAGVALLGVGSVGSELLRRLTSPALRALHTDRFGLACDVVALGDSSGLIAGQPAPRRARALPGHVLTAALEAKAGRRSLATLATSTSMAAGDGRVAAGEGRQTAAANEAQVRHHGSLDAWLQTLPRALLRALVLVDCSASSATGPALARARAAGASCVLANKKPLSGPQATYNTLVRKTMDFSSLVRFESTVGAGLPVNATLARLVASGDTVRGIDASLSGTLGFLMTQLAAGQPFSAAVADAKRLGFTEPDPRDDLSGMDVARKALILVRGLGYDMELSDIAIEPLFPPRFAAIRTVAGFMASLPELDEGMASRVASARAKDPPCELRYTASVEVLSSAPRTMAGKESAPAHARARVGLVEVPADSALGSLRGTENLVAFTTACHPLARPLVIRGAGAGREVTATGVLADIVEVAAAVATSDMERVVSPL